MNLNRYLPVYHFHEIHHIQIQASTEKIFIAMKSITPGEMSWPIVWMMALRNLPGWLMGKGWDKENNNRPLIEQMLKNGFVLLDEKPSQEIVFGFIGQFWRLIPRIARVADSQGFIEFQVPGYAKGATNLLAERRNNGIRLSTETRVQALDKKAHRLFVLYWLLISAGSSLIRILWLRAIKRKAEGMD